MAEYSDIVIGYHPSDLEFVEKLAAKLKGAGFSVCYSKSDDDGKKTSEAILGCKIYLPVMTEASVVDKTIQEQLSLAYISNSAVYPLSNVRFRFIGPKLSGGAKLMLAKINWCFVFNMDEFDAKTDALIKCMKKDMAVQSPRSPSDNLAEAGFSLDSALNHGLDLGGDGSGFEGMNKGVDMSSLGADASFWDRHFKGKSEVPWERFKEKFLQDYGQKIEEDFTDLKEEKKNFFMNLMYKEVFDTKKTVSKQVFHKFCVNDHPHAFYTRMQEYAVAYMSLRQVIGMDSGLRISTIQSLGEFSFPAIVSGLSDMLKDEDPNIRAVAAIALAHAGKDRSATVDELVSLLQDEDRLVRESACLSLGFLRSTRALNHVVDRWRNDPISTVREAAELALSKMDAEDAQRCMKVTQVLSSEMKALKPAETK